VAMTRYNRVEGLSTGLGIDEQVGGGYSISALGRFGFADHEPNVELSGARTNLATTLRLTGYNHLVAANDWGNPLSFGSSLRAFLFGRDEGFYYRATGAELTSTKETGANIEWRLFAERERSATENTTFSLGAAFPPNLAARRGDFAGGSVRWVGSHGIDPMGWQFFSDLRLEAAGGDSAYGRGALDLTTSHALGQSAAASLTLSGGNSLGNLPPQRRWYLGGTETVRGQSPDTAQSGNAYWLTRAQLGYGPSAVRANIFGDLGWTGDRTKLSDVGRPLSGVGAGLSMIDGLIRFDVARGIFPRQQWRVDLYFEARY
ncbi:MAG TPA: ShlB/FhaC/HecB family hemolysin secretion/activation protein, partial [Gemmatimonadaceae bacterium]|nr:ShlB/FhaC/HecB family hemolysin secretion/activation protein [Gemmatimonadaceae bacterium]